MTDVTLEELKALVAENSRAIGRQEKLHARRREEIGRQEKLYARRQEDWRAELHAERAQWREEFMEELRASRQEYDRMIACRWRA